MQLPKPEVAGIEDHAPPAGVCMLHRIGAFELDQRHQPIRWHRAELDQIQQVAANGHVGRARDRSVLARRPDRKCDGQVGQGEPPAPRIERVERPSERRADRQHEPAWQEPSQDAHLADDQVFEQMTHCHLGTSYS